MEKGIQRSVMVSSTITSKGQTTLPKPVRQALGVTAGDRVCYVVHDNSVRLLPVRPIGRLFGALKHDGPPMSLEDMERGIAKGACEEHAAAVAVKRPSAPSGAARPHSAHREASEAETDVAGEAVAE